jgi:hypothetical protein
MVSSILGLVICVGLATLNGVCADVGFPLSAQIPTLADARERMEIWRRFCGEDRPHNAIGYKVLI